MTVAPGFSAEEIRTLVEEYEDLPHGSKDVWLEDRGLCKAVMRRWRKAHRDGELGRGLAPHQRPTGAVALARARAAEDELERIREETKAKIAALEQAHQAQLAERDARIEMLAAGNLTLERAIGHLQKLDSRGTEGDSQTRARLLGED